MHPAPSVIAFTTLSGMGFGLLFFLGLGHPSPGGWPAFFWWGLGYGLAVAGLLASTFHLGNRRNAVKGFSQWRTSWLSREAWGSVATLLILAPVALSDWLGLGWSRHIGQLGAVLAVGTVFTTSMIYAQLKTVPRWHHWTTPALFLGCALTGGAILAGHPGLGAVSSLALAALLAFAFQDGDSRFARAGQNTGTATGLGAIGTVKVFEQPHTSPNYLMREMIHVVGRKHALRLRRIALALIMLAGLTTLLPGPAMVLAALLHLAGALTARWLFFAEAEHVVGLFYGRR